MNRFTKEQKNQTQIRMLYLSIQSIYPTRSHPNSPLHLNSTFDIRSPSSTAINILHCIVYHYNAEKPIPIDIIADDEWHGDDRPANGVHGHQRRHIEPAQQASNERVSGIRSYHGQCCGPTHKGTARTCSWASRGSGGDDGVFGGKGMRMQ